MALNTSRNKRQHAQMEEEGEDMQFSDEEGTIVDDIFIPAPIKPVTCHTSKTRLVITKITNNFFKSYAENVILGPFSKCFNAIVGPNGSGKSNVIDSMLFVFGYRATKIRSKKISVLLHNSEAFPKVQNCTVSVHFCEIIDKEGDNFEIVPGSDFVVSRTASKDNSSFYELNGKRVQFKTVGKLLKQHGIDLDHNRFLILQGEVEEIAMMKPKGATENETGMLEYLEDIIGTGRYKKPIAQLKEKVESLSEKRIEKLNRLNLISKELEQLKAPMEEAVEFLNLENRIVRFKNIQYQKAIFDEEDKAKEIEAEVDEVKGKLSEIKDKLKKLTNEKVEKEKELQEETLKYQKLEKNKEKLKEEYNAADKKDVQLQAEMRQSNTNRKKLKQQLEEERKKLSKLESVPEESRKAIEECEAKEQELTNKKEKLEAEKTKLLSKIAQDTKDLCADKEKWELQLNQKKKIVATTKAAYDLAESELKIAKSQEENEKNKTEKLQDTLKNCIEALKERTEQVAELQKKMPLTEKSLNDATRELQAIQNEEAQLNQEIRRNRMSLEEAKASMNKSSGRGRVLDALMQQKREGNCPGLYGRLGDLGGIDAKYDVAISTACGPLDNMVVDTAETAKWCIEFLKKHGLPKTTFIALDRQEHLRQLANTKISTPENVHRLFDLIQIQDETVKTAFYYGLRDTLVANDLDQATRIAYGATRYRVVTLIGEMIETSGTMSGGGKSMLRGRMGRNVVTTNVNSKDLEKMDINLKKTEERLRVLGERQTFLDGEINRLQPELSKMRLNMQKFSKELQSLKIQEPNLKKQLQVQEKIANSTKSDGQQIRKLTQSLEKKKVEYDTASKAAQEIQVEVDLLTEKIREKTEGKTKTLNKDLIELSKGLEKITAEITRLNVAITASARNVKKLTQKIETIAQNITDTENRLREMNHEREQNEAHAQKLLKNIEEIGKELEDGNEGYHQLKKSVAKLTADEQKLLPEKCDIELNCKTAMAKFNEINAIIHQWRAKLARLKLHKDIPEVDDEPLKTFTPDEIRVENSQKIELELHTLQNKIKNSTPNLEVIEEYRKGQLTYIERNNELEEVTNKRNEMNDLRIKVEDQRKDEFMVGYNVIRAKLKQMYQMITLGGDADFEIADQIDPFLEGIQFNVRPPKKSWKTISNLSGGEKTLSSLALVFALHYYKPSPLYVMDEIDAALDFKNVSIVGNYIKDRTKNAQFIIISLRSNMFELCDNLVGIYKIFNCTHTITIDPRGFDKEVTNESTNNQNKKSVDQNMPKSSDCSEKNSQGSAITISSDTISDLQADKDHVTSPITVVSSNTTFSDEPMETE